MANQGCGGGRLQLQLCCQPSCGVRSAADDAVVDAAQKLKPGAPQQPWVQAQTTFAVLVRDENKVWQVRALKQKLLVDTVNYEIQVRSSVDRSSAVSESSLQDSHICQQAQRCSVTIHCW